MSAINEAYARIDLAAIQKLESDIEEIKKVIGGYPFLNYDGEQIGPKSTSVFADRLRIGAKQKIIAISFPSKWFSKIPVVTATIENVDGKILDSNDVTVIIRKITVKGVSILIRRTKEVPVVLNVMAIGRKADDFYVEE